MPWSVKDRPKMVAKIFLFGILGLMFFGMVGAVDCDTIGEINYQTQEYCNNDGVWTDQMVEKAEGCLNNYECVGESCAEGICQSKYAPLFKESNWFEDLWNSWGGIECNPESNVEGIGWKCDNTKYSECGAGYAWELGLEIDGKCGYSSNNGGDGGTPSCTPKWVCSNWSDITNACGTRDCTDSQSCDKTMPTGLQSNSCDVRTFCGDGSCNGAEICGDVNTDVECRSDCDTCPEPPICNKDNTCDEERGETSANCPSDCDKKVNPDYRWLLILIIILLVLAIIIVTLLIIKKLKEDMGGVAQVKDTPKGVHQGGASSSSSSRETSEEVSTKGKVVPFKSSVTPTPTKNIIKPTPIKVKKPLAMKKIQSPVPLTKKVILGKKTTPTGPREISGKISTKGKPISKNVMRDALKKKGI